jgi:hypothetical protein
MQSLVDLWRGIWQQPWKTIQYIFTSFSVIFTAVKAVTYFFPPIKFEGRTPFALAILISVAFGFKKVWKPSRIQIPIANCNSIIEVVFGDLFEQEGIRAIAVNEFFDSIIGKPVSDKSIHGIFLKKCFGGHPESFDKQVAEELKHTPSVEVVKIEGKTRCYPIGSTALIAVNQDKYIAFAFTKTDPQTCKAYSDVTLMWTALNDLWKRVRIEAGGHAVNLPLVGSGLSGMGLPTRDLLNLIILSAITETKAREITQRIRVVLHRSRFGDLDLRDVRQFWSV